MYEDEALDELDEARPNKCKTCCCFIWKLFKCVISHLLLVSMVVSYCILGAFTFEFLEAGNEIKVKQNISTIRVAVTDKIWDLTKDTLVLHQENWTSEVKGHLETFEKDLLRAMKTDGWDGSEGDDVKQWTFAGALFYSIIVITTIGYGHIAPKTHWGKVVTIFYAILGIPLMLLCLSNIGDIMAHSFRFIYWRICCYVCTKKPKRPPSRRGRSFRGTVRQSSSSGRASGRSRSFKYPGRTSQRSADSALGLSESMTRSSYSDTECRYNDDNDLGMTEGGQLRASQRSRYSDTAVPVRTGDTVTPSNSVRSKFDKNEYGKSGADIIRSHVAPPGEYEPQPPVLFNKYALDRDESMRAQRPTKFLTSTLPRQPIAQTYQPSHQYQSSPYGGSLKRQAEVDRNDIPTPPLDVPSTAYRDIPDPARGRSQSQSGSAQRQNSYKPTRLSRVREIPDYGYSENGEEEYETNSGSQSAKVKPVPIWLCVFLVVSYIISGAILFSDWENWNFLDSAYFCFITLTTIGFGDFVPENKDKNPEISIAICSLYSLIGIALLAMSFNLVQEEVINNVKQLAKSLGLIKDDDEVDE